METKNTKAQDFIHAFSSEDSKQYLRTLLKCAVVGIDALEADERYDLVCYYEELCDLVDWLYREDSASEKQI